MVSFVTAVLTVVLFALSTALLLVLFSLLWFRYRMYVRRNRDQTPTQCLNCESVYLKLTTRCPECGSTLMTLKDGTPAQTEADNTLF